MSTSQSSVAPAVTVSPAPVADPVTARTRPVASYRTDLITALLGIWFTGGLFVDAWAHSNVPELETFFTPWHAAFYSGFAATAAWVGWTARHGLRTRDWAQIPGGYGAAVVALAGFALSAAGDYTWHTVIGIEQSIDILFSPTHLGLVTTMVIVVTTPLRTAWASAAPSSPARLRGLLPAVLSAALGAGLVLLFLTYANALVRNSGGVILPLSGLNEGRTAELVSEMALTNLVLLFPLLTLTRRWTLPLGSVTIVYLCAGAVSGAIAGFDNPAILVGLLISGIAVDAVARWLRPGPDRPGRIRTFAALASLITWTGYIATAMLTSPTVRLPAEMGGGEPAPVIEIYTGAPIVQALIGLLVATILTLPAARPRSG